MTKLPKCIFIILTLGIMLALLSQQSSSNTLDDTVTIDSLINSSQEPEVPQFFNKPAEECLMDGLIYHKIQHPEIVYAQAILETGNFTSKGCRTKNNLFGLMKKNRLRSFDHWNESIIFYKERIQSRYDGKSDYYTFLKRINYASDPMYIPKLKQIVRQNQNAWKLKYNSMMLDTTTAV